MKDSLAVVLGAGPVGLEVGKRFVEKGVAVRFVTRSGRPIPGFESVSADIADAEALVAAAEGATILVHAVGIPYQYWARDFPPIQAAVLTAAERTSAVAVFVENLYSYDTSHLPMTEATPEAPLTRKGKVRLALTKQWLAAHNQGRVKAVSVRGSDYFGPGATRSPNAVFGERFFPPLETGKPVAFLGNPDAAHSYVYLPDFARALVDVALDPTSWGRAWIAPTLKTTSAGALARLFAAEADKSVKVGRVPALMLKLLGLFNPVIHELIEMLYQFDRDFIADGSALESHFGWKATDLAVAVKETWRAHTNQV